MMESCLHQHISEYQKENTIISEYHSGFKPTDSTVNQLAYVWNEFAKSIDESKEIRIVFSDKSKSVRYGLAQGLTCEMASHIAFSESILEWFSSYLENHKQRDSVCPWGIASVWLSIFVGVPQGSILGPILFLINVIVKYIWANIRHFADDAIL